ncbi:hypothetical protein CCP3SC15_5680001 [Gammaproteobacteria bacterium]
MIAGAPPPSMLCDTAVTLPATPRNGTGLSANLAGFSFLASGATNQAINILITIAGSSSGITVDAVTGDVY